MDLKIGTRLVAPTRMHRQREQSWSSQHKQTWATKKSSLALLSMRKATTEKRSSTRRLGASVPGYKKFKGDCHGGDIRAKDGGKVGGNPSVEECAEKCTQFGEGCKGLSHDATGEHPICYLKKRTCTNPNDKRNGFIFYEKAAEEQDH